MKNLLKFTLKAFEKWENDAEVVADVGFEYFEPIYKKDEKYWRKQYEQSNLIYLKEVTPKTVMVPYTTYHDVK